MRPPLDRDRILRAALALLDADGAGAVSMRGVARVLGVTPMALYRHVPDKRALLDGIAELVAEQIAPARAAGAWDERVRAVAHGLRGACRAHPAAVPLLQSTRSTAPALLAPAEAVLAALADAGLDDGAALGGWSALVGLTLGHVAYELGGHAEPGPLPAPDGRGAPAAAAAPDAAAFPRIAAALAPGKLDFDRAFATALESLIAGWRAQGGARVRAPLHAGGRAYTLRGAVAADVPAIVELLAADQLGARRDGGPDRAPYERAFAAIAADPAQILVSVTAPGGGVVGTLQLTIIPGLARRGALRGQIEAVRVHTAHRGGGLGGAMVGWAIAEARRRGCSLVQLTTDKRRAGAHRFYERLGFVASHEGLKLKL